MQIFKVLAEKFLVYRLGPICAIFIVGFIAETLRKAEKQSSFRERLLNAKATLAYHVVDFLVVPAILILIGISIERIPHRPLLLRNHDGMTFAVLLAFLVSFVGDLGQYWMHRWQHTSKWLWPIHQLHHSDKCVNVTTTFRRHWLESVPFTLATMIPPSLFLPRSSVALPLAYFITFAHGFIGHFNCPLDLGWLNYVVLTPPDHRIHHSILPEHFNKNFAGVWPIWDIIFGTYASPRRGEHVPTGLLSGETVDSFREAHEQPFRCWADLLSTR